MSTIRSLRNTPSRLCHIKNILSNCAGSEVTHHIHKRKNFSSSSELSFMENNDLDYTPVLSQDKYVSLNDSAYSSKENVKGNDIKIEREEFSSQADVALLESCPSQVTLNKNQGSLDLLHNQSQHNATGDNFKVYSKDSSELFKCFKCKRTYRTKESYEKHETLCTFVIDSSSEEDDEDDDESTEVSDELETKPLISPKVMVDKCIQTDSELVEIPPDSQDPPVSVHNQLHNNSSDTSSSVGENKTIINDKTHSGTATVVSEQSNSVTEPCLAKQSSQSKAVRRKSNIVKCTDDEVAEKVRAILSQQPLNKEHKTVDVIKENPVNNDTAWTAPSSLSVTSADVQSPCVNVASELPPCNQPQALPPIQFTVPTFPVTYIPENPVILEPPVVPVENHAKTLSCPPTQANTSKPAVKRVRSTKKPDYTHPVFRPKTSVPLSILPKPDIMLPPKQNRASPAIRKSTESLQVKSAVPDPPVPQVDPHPGYMYGAVNSQPSTFINTVAGAQPLSQLNSICNDADIIQIPYGTLVIPKKSNNVGQTVIPAPQQAPLIYDTNYSNPFGSVLMNSQPHLSYLGSITVAPNDAMNLSLPMLSPNLNCSPSPLNVLPQQPQYIIGSTQDIIMPHFQDAHHQSGLNYVFQNASVPHQALNNMLPEPILPFRNTEYLTNVSESQYHELEQNCEQSQSVCLPDQVACESNCAQGAFGSGLSPDPVEKDNLCRYNCDQMEQSNGAGRESFPTMTDVRHDNFKDFVPEETELRFPDSSCDHENGVSEKSSVCEQTNDCVNDRTSSNNLCHLVEPDLNAHEKISCKTDEGSQRDAIVNIKDEPANPCPNSVDNSDEKKVPPDELSKLCYSDTFISIIRKAAEQMFQLSSKLAEQKETMQNKKCPDTVPKVAAVFRKKNLKNCKDSGVAVLPPLAGFDEAQLKLEQDYDYCLKASLMPSKAPRKRSCSSLSAAQDSASSESQSLKGSTAEQKSDGAKVTALQHNTQESRILFEISNEDGFCVRSTCIKEAWQAVLQRLQQARKEANLPVLNVNEDELDGLAMMGLKHSAVTYLLEQLPGAEKCLKYKFKFHRPLHPEKLLDNPNGCVRAEEYRGRGQYDMFNFLASRHRRPPMYDPGIEEEDMSLKSSRRATSLDLPMAMRFRHLKDSAREAVGVYKSRIHGRGLFCKRPIDAGEMIIEYAGEVIRSVLTDKREKLYESKGIGCYMFRIDDNEVVDATMHGNAARFINHSCDPNCFSRVISLDGKKHIVIFALRRIWPGEELTYDYKFPFEEIKIPCTCGSKKCRKYLN